MAKRLVFCILLFSISLTSYARFDEYTAEKALYRAKRLHKELIMDNTKPAPDDFKQVFAAYRSVIERFPKWEQREIVLLIIGDLYSENKQYEEAKESYLDIIRISYQNMMAKLPVNINIAARARYKIALNYEKQGNWPLAEENLIKVAADYPNTLDALFVPLYRAEYYYKEGNQERAEKIYQEALGRYLEIIDTKPKSRLAFTARKLIEKSYENVQKWEEMAETLRQAIKNNPNAKVAFVELGKIYQRQNKIEEAIQTFKKVIERYPDYLEAQLDLGKLYNDIGRFDLALEVAEKISKKQEYNIGAIVLKGYTHFYKRSYSSALKFFKRAINLGSNNPEIYNLIGVIQLKFSKYEEAREALEASLELQPDSAPVHVNLGNLYMAEGKYELAEKEYLTAIKHDNRLLAAYANLANLKVNRRQMDKAVEIYEQMLTINPKLYLVEYHRSEEHTSELQSHSFISYAVFCLKKKKTNTTIIIEIFLYTHTIFPTIYLHDL